MLNHILNTQSYSGNVEEMTNLIADYARSFGADVRVVDGNVYVTKGRSLSQGFPCIVAHTDTVHKIIPKDDFQVVYASNPNIAFGWDKKSGNFSGIGGDDKVGIYIALSAVQYFDNIKACFFRDEEIGCVGSGLADMTFFNDCMYILQCDRKGKSDFVDNISGTKISSDEFKNDVSGIISRYGYKFHNGGLTDVYKLVTKGVGISVANMSCGYYNPHCDEEFINIDDMTNTKDMVFELIETLDKRYEHKYVEPTYGYGYGTKYYKNSNPYQSKPPHLNNPGMWADWYDGPEDQFNNVDNTSLAPPDSQELALDYEEMIPEDDIIVNMTTSDIYEHSYAVVTGKVRYLGKGVYAYDLNKSETSYIPLSEIPDELFMNTQLTDDRMQLCMDIETEILEKKELMYMMMQGYEKECVSCLSPIDDDHQTLCRHCR